MNLLASPPYRELQRHPWRVRRISKSGPMLGYVSGWTTLPPGSLFWAFDRATSDPARPWQVWMSDAPGEREMHQIPVHHASGHVVVAGLGMGLAAWDLCQRREVERVTVLEHDPAVIELWHAHGIKIPKLTILECDALAVRRLGVVDLLYVDIWLRYGRCQNLADTQRMVWRIRPHAVYFWGQEHNIAAWTHEHSQHVIDAETCHEFACATRLPLLGVRMADYPAFIRRAVDCLDARMTRSVQRN